jgi:hypothetical protein
MGFFELETPESMLEKAKRELTRLEGECSIDNVYNFFVTAYHIVDTLPTKLPKADVLKEDLIQRCADACNKAKHMELKRNRPDVKTPKHYHLVAGAPLDASNPSVKWCIVWKDGTSLEVVSFARDVIAKWEDIFRKHKIGA